MRTFLCMCVSVKKSFVCLYVLMKCVTRCVRTANPMVMDSCCRGGIVHIRFGCACVRGISSNGTTALWRFHASTSNSLIGRSWPQTHTHLRYIDQIYAQQDIRVCEDDHF